MVVNFDPHGKLVVFTQAGLSVDLNNIQYLASTKIRKKTLALVYLATFEPMKISPALDNRIVLNFIRNL